MTEELKRGKGGKDNPGRGKLPPEEQRKLLQIYTKDRYRDLLKKINYNLNTYGTIHGPEDGTIEPPNNRGYFYGGNA